jgi:glycosyltransferase involved in cell wall biosynthesis
MGEIVVNSTVLRSRYSLSVLPLTSAASIADLGGFSTGKLLKLLDLGRVLAAHCLMERPDLIYFTLTPNGKAFYRDLLYVGIMKLFGIRRVYHLHGKGLAQAITNPLNRWLYRWAFSDAEVILLSSRLYEDCAEVVGSERCYFLSNGIPDPWDSGETGKTRSVVAGPPRILFFSNLMVSKGIFVLLEALAIIKAKGMSFRASFAGDWESRAVEAAFKQFLYEKGLQDSVELCGPRFGDEKRYTYANSDIMAFPSYNDAYPLVILEAMSHALPVVSTYEGAIPDMVEDGVTGFLVPRKDPLLLADRLSALLLDPKMRMQMGKTARSRYLAYFTNEVFETKLGDILGKCLTLQ